MEKKKQINKENSIGQVYQSFKIVIKFSCSC